jgi:hypothetical protein
MPWGRLEVPILGFQSYKFGEPTVNKDGKSKKEDNK